MRPWSELEDLTILALLPVTYVEDIADILGRTSSSVRSRTYRLRQKGLLRP